MTKLTANSHKSGQYLFNKQIRRDNEECELHRSLEGGIILCLLFTIIPEHVVRGSVEMESKVSVA